MNSSPSSLCLPASVLLVGAGRMGGALLRGWGEDVAVSVLDPNAPDDLPAPRLSDPGEISALPTPTLVVLAVKPNLIRTVLEGFRGVATPDTLFVSIAAGTRLSTLQQSLGADAQVARAMPNIAVASRSGATALCFGAGLSAGQRASCESLFSLVGECITLGEEALLDVSTAIAGSGPAYFFRFAEALAAAGHEAGLPEEDALRLARATLAGAGSLCKDGRGLSELREEVTSPGGTTAAALDQLNLDGRIDKLAAAAVEAAIRRSGELAG